nr:transposase zinc-binding domain-containing protein [Labilithrix luteola]
MRSQAAARGFVQAGCETCEHDLLVAFRCKLRGICPSCTGRRMANTAALLDDRVLPAVPLPQWGLSLPFDLLAVAAFDAKVLRALVLHFVFAIEFCCRAWAKRAAVARRREARGGAVTFVQRFGSSLNLNVHFHVVVLDRVYVREADGQLVRCRRRPGLAVLPRSHG